MNFVPVVIEEEQVAICPACVAEAKQNRERILACWGGDCINANTVKTDIRDSEDESEDESEELYEDGCTDLCDEFGCEDYCGCGQCKSDREQLRIAKSEGWGELIGERTVPLRTPNWLAKLTGYIVQG